MTESALLKQIESAKLVLNDAERDLRAAVGLDPRTVEDEGAVKTASLRLKAAETQLIALERLLALSDIEAEKKKVETARTAVSQAEKGLETVLSEAVVTPANQETWVTDVVSTAFAELKAAKAQLLDLETSITTEKS